MTTDIIEDIDALEAEVGEYEIAYLQGDYERCPRCGRHWHGLPVTERVAAMYQRGQYDPDYNYTDDDSPILCEGSDFIGPLRPTRWERVQAEMEAGFAEAGRRMTAITISMSEAAERAAAMWREREHQLLEAIMSWPNPFLPRIAVYTRRRDGVVALSGYLIPEPDLDLDLSQWFGTATSSAGPPPEVEFGPQWWHLEIDAPRRRQQYWPRPHGFHSPLDYAVRSVWPQLTADTFPVPERPGIDFDTLAKQVEQQVSGRGPSPDHAHRFGTDHRRAGLRRPSTAQRRRRRRRRA